MPRVPSARNVLAWVAATALAGCLADPLGTNSPGPRPVTVTPAAANVPVGATVQLTAVASDAPENPTSAGVVSWTTSDSAVATVSSAGLVTGVAPGSVVIAATIDGRNGTASITVSMLPPGTVHDLATKAATDSSVTLTFTEVSDGAGQPADYDVRYAAGSLSWGRGSIVTRGTCATPVMGAAVGARRTCTVLGLAAGTSTSFELVAFRGTLNANAVFGGLSNVAVATTAGSTAPVASLRVTPPSATVIVGGARQFVAILKDAKGNDLSGRAVSWASSAPALATVNMSGLVTAVAVGTATLTATSEGQRDSALVSVVASLPPVSYYSTNFADGTTGPLSVHAYGGGSCQPSTDYRDPGSAYSMKCTIPAGTGAAALEAWFGNGNLAGLPKDPSLDQDLFEQVRFVLAPGAAAAIGGTVCTPLNLASQFKVHKSVYGRAGSAWNGWVMSAIGPCTSQNIGLFSEAELWNIDGHTYPWPNTFPSVREGTVYDIVYRYHRYTAQNCGTIAVWVNDFKVWDSPCQTYLGATNGSEAGLLFWDGATYLQNGVGPYVVYTLFAQASNYPIGAATRSP